MACGPSRPKFVYGGMSHPIRAKKRYGQHFLVDPNYIHKIVHAIMPKASDTFLEIGPGMGAMTLPLLDYHPKMTLLEIDPQAVEYLSTQPQCAQAHVSIIQEDALDFDFFAFFKAHPEPVRVAGNLPYNVATPILFRLFEQISHIEDLHIMVQKEVADRLVAHCNTSAYGRLGIMAQYHCDIERLFNVPKGAFSPPPKVESSFLRLKAKPPLPTPVNCIDNLSKVVKLAFATRRKTLANNFKGILSAQQLSALGISPSQRAQTLTLEQFIALANSLDASP